MKTLRFGIYAGALWALVSLVLIAASVLMAYRLAWVELDFRVLSGTLLLAADALGFGESLSGIAIYADTGLPVTPLHVTACAALSFADGFVSGVIIAIVYNALTGNRRISLIRKALSFGIAAGITLGIASGLLALTSMAYGLAIVSFDFTVRPVWVTFYILTKTGMPGVLYPLWDSYVYFPARYAGALAWAGWGFIDGLAEGAVIAYLYLRIRDSV
ncbi:MAG: hypothetical protein ACREOP_11690 [Thermodesulfobacteriota bacterium]